MMACFDSISNGCVALGADFGPARILSERFMSGCVGVNDYEKKWFIFSHRRFAVVKHRYRFFPTTDHPESNWIIHLVEIISLPLEWIILRWIFLVAPSKLITFNLHLDDNNKWMKLCRFFFLPLFVITSLLGQSLLLRLVFQKISIPERSWTNRESRLAWLYSIA